MPALSGPLHSNGNYMTFVMEYVADILPSQHGRRLSDCENIDYYSPADTYTASAMVNYGHYLSGTEFCRSEDYYNQASITPIVLVCVYCFMLLCFFGGMFGRMFYEDCKCRPPRDDVEEFEKQKTMNFTLFYIMGILVLILDQLVFIGNVRVDHAVNTMEDSTSSVAYTMRQLRGEGRVLVYFAANFTEQYNEAVNSCNTSSNALMYINSNITQYESASTTFTEAVAPVFNFLTDVDSTIEQYGVLYRSAALYFIWALAVLFSGGLLVWKKFEFTYGMKMAMWFGVCTYTLYALLSGPWTFSTSLLADLCVTPSYNAVKSMPVEDSLRDIGTYFSTCTGNCTLTVNADLARRSAHHINDSVVRLLQSDCPHNEALGRMRGTLESVKVSLDALYVDLDCGPLQSQWFSFWNDGVCRDLYEGTFCIWGSQLLTSFFLFILIVCVSVTYQFYADPESVYPELQKDKNEERVDTHPAESSSNDIGDMVRPSDQPGTFSRVMSYDSDDSDNPTSRYV